MSNINATAWTYEEEELLELLVERGGTWTTIAVEMAEEAVQLGIPYRKYTRHSVASHWNYRIRDDPIVPPLREALRTTGFIDETNQARLPGIGIRQAQQKSPLAALEAKASAAGPPNTIEQYKGGKGKGKEDRKGKGREK